MNVVVTFKNKDPEIWENAYLQADNPTVIIRQQVDGCWTSTAVYAPGTYLTAKYQDERTRDRL